MKTTRYMTAALLLLGAAASAQEVEVPEGVKYKYASDAVNGQAMEKVRLAFSATERTEGLQTLFGTRVICGPYLWNQIKADPAMAELKKGQVLFRIPVTTREGATRTDSKEGKLFQSPDEIAVFCSALAKIYDYDQERTVRKLTARELRLHWSMISWNISEPILVVQSPSHRILLAFAGQLSVVMIDDYRALGAARGSAAAADSPEAEPAAAAKLNRLRLYVPIPELGRRFGKDVRPLTDYIKRLQQAAVTILDEQEQFAAKGLLIAVGIKSKTQARVWCQAVEGELPAELLERLEKELAAVPAVDLEQGPAGFALEVNLAGQQPEKYPEFPDVWLQAARESETSLLMPPDELFQIIWPD